MKKKNILLTVLTITLVAMITFGAVQDSRAMLESPSSFEENHYDIELDFWLNTTGTIAMLGVDNEGESMMLHARYSFSSRETLQNIYGFDVLTNEQFFEDEGLNAFYCQGAYSQYTFVEDVRGEYSPELVVFEPDDDDETDNYWAMGGGATSEVYQPMSEETFLDAGATTCYLMNKSKAYDDTTEPTLTLDSQNLMTKDDDAIYMGVTYTAGEAMTVNQYAAAICAMNGVTLYDIANASTLSWLMKDSVENNDINAISIDFEAPQIDTNGFGIRAGILKRFSFSLLKRAKDKVYSTASTLRRNLLTRIPLSRVISGIRAVPSAAQYFDFAKIGSNWFTKNLGVRANAGGLKNTIVKLIGTLTSGTGIAIMAIGYVLIGGLRVRKGKKFLFKPWKGKWIKGQ